MEAAGLPPSSSSSSSTCWAHSDPGETSVVSTQLRKLDFSYMIGNKQKSGRSLISYLVFFRTYFSSPDTYIWVVSGLMRLQELIPKRHLFKYEIELQPPNMMNRSAARLNNQHGFFEFYFFKGDYTLSRSYLEF